MTRNPSSDDSTDREPSTNVSRRRFMKAGGASVAAATGFNAVADAAEAAHGSGRNTIIVVGRGEGHHSYQIQMESGGTIRKAANAGSNDSHQNNPAPRIEGNLWHWNVDSYEYTGEIRRVVGDGSVSFQFPDGAFRHDERIVAGGVEEEFGRSDYVIGTNSGDIDPVEETTGDGDTDHGGSRTEKDFSNDHVTGFVQDNGVDTYDIGGSQPVQYVQVDDGHVAVGAYTTGAATTATSGRKEASIVYHYMGDGPFATFFQNFDNDLQTPQKDYDRSVLLKHRNTSVAAQAMADRIEDPTRENFEDVVHSLVEQGYTIDIYIMSHGLRGEFKMSDGSFGSEDWYDTGDVERLRAQFDGQLPIRMVYQCHCWGQDMNQAWRNLGAKAVMGSRYVNFFPTQWGDFAIQWRRGATFEQAKRRANTVTSRMVVRNALNIDIGATRNGRWGNSAAHSACTDWIVLQTGGGCAKDYFTNRWNHTDAEWHSIVARDGDPFAGGDGWAFVRESSRKHIAGDGSITRNFYY